MRKRCGAAMWLALTTALGVAACSETTRSLTAPERSAGEAQALLGGLTSTLTSLLIAPVERTTPLAANVTWSFVAGPGGAYSSNPAVGLSVAVPPGALSSTVTITVTALAGAPVAYRFEPHLTFARKVQLTQNLSGTKSGLLGSLLLKGAHFAGDLLQLNPDGLAIVDEIVPAFVLSLTRKATFGVNHFSGWILASGNGEAE
jgi:hypothetical protein